MLTNEHGNAQHSDPKRFSGYNRMLDAEPAGRDLEGFGKVWINIFRFQLLNGRVRWSVSGTA